MSTSYKLEPAYEKAYWDMKMKPSYQSNVALVQALDPIIRQSILAAGGNSRDMLLLARARKMVMDSIERYDPQAAPLKNFVYSQLRGLNRVVGNQANMTGLSEDASRDINKLNTAEKELLEDLGRYPSTNEIADYTGLSLKRIAKLRQSNVPVTEAMLEARFGTNVPTSSIVGDTTAADTWMDFVYHDLNPRAQSVMERIYGLNGYQPMQAREVAKELKISDAAVSQHRKNIEKLLNADEQFDLFGG